MEVIERTLIFIGSAVISYFLGGWTILLSTLIILNAFDYVTGITKSRRYVLYHNGNYFVRRKLEEVRFRNAYSFEFFY